MSQRPCSHENLSVGSLSSDFLSAVRTNDPKAWERLVYLYRPVVHRWCVFAGVPSGDVADISQEVFLGVSTGLARFRRDRENDSFMAWLRTIVRNKIADFWRRREKSPRIIGGSSFQRSVQQIAVDLSSRSLSSSTDISDETLVVCQALKLIRQQFQPKTWKAFWETAVACRTCKEVAADLQMSEMAVRQAKSRVLRRLRENVGVI